MYSADLKADQQTADKQNPTSGRKVQSLSP